MIHKPFLPKFEHANSKKRKPRKDPTATFKYLLKQKGEPRPHARLLSGDPEVLTELCKSVIGEDRFEAGCLSFDKRDKLTEEQKRDLMQSFEEALLPGLQGRYSIVWVEHMDKSRLELNYVIARTDLPTGTKMTPYVHKYDKNRMRAWQQYENAKSGWQCPDDPSKKQASSKVRNTPQKTQSLKDEIHEQLTQRLNDMTTANRADVVSLLNEIGANRSEGDRFAVSRCVGKSISIQHEGSKRAVRLTGDTYTAGFQHVKTDDPEAAKQELADDYEARARKRAFEAKQTFDRLYQSKLEYNTNRFINNKKNKHEPRSTEKSYDFDRSHNERTTKPRRTNSFTGTTTRGLRFSDKRSNAIARVAESIVRALSAFAELAVEQARAERERHQRWIQRLEEKRRAYEASLKHSGGTGGTGGTDGIVSKPKPSPSPSPSPKPR